MSRDRARQAHHVITAPPKTKDHLATMKVSTLIRWLFALGTLALCITQVMGAFRIGRRGAAGNLILGFGGLVAFVVLIAPDTILPACEFISRISTSVVLPDDKNHKPTLSYVLARHYRKQLRHAEAVEQYQTIIQHFNRDLPLPEKRAGEPLRLS